MSFKNNNTLVSLNQLEIIDMALLESNTEDEYLKIFALKLRKAIYHKGLVLLINHGISETKIQKVWKSFDKFLEEPIEIKEKYKRSPDCYTGYYPPGIEVFNNKKQFEFRHTFNITEILEEKIPNEFYDEVCDLIKDYKALSYILLKSMALSLDMPKSFFTEKHSKMFNDNVDNFTTLRLLYYPPVTEDIKNCSNCIRCGDHKDYGTFTLLSQDSEGGLQIKLPGTEEWQTVGYLPGSIIMNCGEMLDLWTNNRYPAVNHRVIVPEEEENKTNSRHSIAFFVHPDNETNICPNEIPFPDKNPLPSNKKIWTAKEYTHMRLRETLGFY